MKIKKRKKSVRMRAGSTHGHGARKKRMGSGHRGGFGMAGTGKRADHKKFQVIKKYGKYFGRQGFTSRKTERRKNNVINLRDIQKNIESLMKKSKGGFINLEKYKILGEGEIKKKLKIKAKSVSKSARAKIEKLGGEIFLGEKKEEKKSKE